MLERVLVLQIRSIECLNIREYDGLDKKHTLQKPDALTLVFFGWMAPRIRWALYLWILPPDLRRKPRPEWLAACLFTYTREVVKQVDVYVC